MSEFTDWNLSHFKIYKSSMKPWTKQLQKNYFVRKYLVRYDYIDLVDGNFIWRSSILDSKKLFLLSLSTKRIISSTPFPDRTSFFILNVFFSFLERINPEEQVSSRRNWKLLRYNNLFWCLCIFNGSKIVSKLYLN